jgi:allantoin racemase
MKILWIVPITGSDEKQMRETADFLRKYSFAETEVIMRKVNRGTESIESRLDEVYASVPILEEVKKGEKEGFDACVIACAGDAGVDVAREISSFPVIGPGEAAILISQLLGRRVVVLTSLPGRIPSIEENVARFIPPNQFFVYPTHIPVIEFQKDVDKTLKTLVEIVRKSIAKDRVDTAILLCLGMQGMAEKVRKEVGIPVIDPALAALQMAQAMVKMGLSQAKGFYPFPPEKKRFL